MLLHLRCAKVEQFLGIVIEDWLLASGVEIVPFVLEDVIALEIVVEVFVEVVGVDCLIDVCIDVVDQIGRASCRERV